MVVTQLGLKARAKVWRCRIPCHVQLLYQSNGWLQCLFMKGSQWQWPPCFSHSYVFISLSYAIFGVFSSPSFSAIHSIVSSPLFPLSLPPQTCCVYGGHVFHVGLGGILEKPAVLMSKLEACPWPKCPPYSPILLSAPYPPCRSPPLYSSSHLLLSSSHPSAPNWIISLHLRTWCKTSLFCPSPTEFHSPTLWFTAVTKAVIRYLATWWWQVELTVGCRQNQPSFGW